MVRDPRNLSCETCIISLVYYHCYVSCVCQCPRFAIFRGLVVKWKVAATGRAHGGTVGTECGPNQKRAVGKNRFGGTWI